jgi:hypothetical protein
MRKIIDIAAIASLVISGGLLGTAIFTYAYITNPTNQEKAKSYLIKQVAGGVTDSLPSIPSVTGGAQIPGLGSSAGKSGKKSSPFGGF